jgi:peroxiredoxin
MKTKVLLILLIVVALTYFAYLHQSNSGVKVGALAPNFTLPGRTGSVSLSDYRGKTVLLNFWATWCPPCAREMPSLEALKKLLEGRPFQLVAVSVDEGGWAAVDAFLRRLPMTMMILSDAKGDVASLYGTFRLPESYLIDKEGKVIKKYTGPEDWMEESIVTEINSHL